MILPWLTNLIEDLYGELVALGYLYRDLEKMTYDELIDTIEKRREMMAYSLWKQAVLISQSLTKSFPETPKDAFEEFWPKKKATLQVSPLLMSRLEKNNG